MLSVMRNSRGGPDWRLRLLAVVLALLLAAPLTFLALQLLGRAIDLAI